MEPRIHGIDTRALALSLVNIILETGGEAVGERLGSCGDHAR